MVAVNKWSKWQLWNLQFFCQENNSDGRFRNFLSKMEFCEFLVNSYHDVFIREFLLQYIFYLI